MPCLYNNPSTTMTHQNTNTILLTGAAGFIGYHLAQRLINDGWNVIGYDNINDYYDINLKLSRLEQLGIDRDAVCQQKAVVSSITDQFSFILGSLEDEVLLSSVFDKYKPQFVCNLAAQAGVRYSIDNPMAYINSNIVGFTNILELSRKHQVQHLVYASSSSVYGLNAKMPFSTHAGVDHPVSLYAATKKSNELMAHVYSQLYQLPTTGLRFFTVYGPWGRPDMSPMLFADAIMNGKPIKVFNHGNMARDFTYIDDIIEGVVRVINQPATASANWDASNPDPATSCVPYRIYNIGNSSPVKLMDYIETLENALGKPAVKEFYPMQPGDVLNTFSDVSDLEKEFGYKPGTPLSVGLSRFAAWYKSYYGF
jgi:UDP-glucuronate 4-epimerase